MEAVKVEVNEQQTFGFFLVTNSTEAGSNPTEI